MVVGIREFISLIRDARVEDEWNTLFDQPGHMSVGKFGRVTFRLAWDGLDTELIYLSGGRRREYHAVFQSREKFKPERIVFVHIEDTRDADRASVSFVCFQRLAVKQKLVLIFKQIRNLFFVTFFSDTTLAAVSGHKLTAAGEAVDRQTALVGTALTFCHIGSKLKAVDLINGEHRGLHTILVTFAGNQGSTESTHDTGDIRTDRFTSGNLFKTAKNGIIVESTTLHNDVFAKFRSIGNFDYFIKCIFDDRIGKSGRNISDLCSFFLCLLYFGVHKNGTACTKVDRVFCKKSGFGEILHTVVQRFCKRFNERTAAGGACFVELYAVNGLIFDFDTFHILTTDIQDTVYFRIKESRCIIMRYRFDFPFIEQESRLDQCLAVAGRTGTDDPGGVRQLFVNILDRTDRGL